MSGKLSENVNMNIVCMPSENANGVNHLDAFPLYLAFLSPAPGECQYCKYQCLGGGFGVQGGDISSKTKNKNEAHTWGPSERVLRIFVV